MGAPRVPPPLRAAATGAAWILAPLHGRLVLYALGAGAMGVLLPDLAGAVSHVVLALLAGQVLGVALTVPARRFAAVARHPLPVLAALAAQWATVPPLGLAVGQLTQDQPLRDGVVILVLVPAEITSSLVAILAGADGAYAVACMATSLVLGCVLTPVWAAALLGGGARVDRAALVAELALAVALPLVAGVGVRTRFPRVAAHSSRALDLSALCVVAVVFVGAGAARALILSPRLLVGLGLCLLLQGLAYAAGALAAAAVRAPPEVSRAMVFPVGMQEFGIATAVALSVAPESAGLAGVYGVALIVVAPVLARLVRLRRSRAPGPSGTRPGRAKTSDKLGPP